MSGVIELRKWINEEGYEITLSNIVGFNDKIHIRITDPRTNAIYITIVDRDLDSIIKDFAPDIKKSIFSFQLLSRWSDVS